MSSQLTATFHASAMSTPTADQIRARMRDDYGNDLTAKVDDGTGPCRHCLQYAKPGDRLILFSYRPFEKPALYQEVGPVFIHADGCERYAGSEMIPPAYSFCGRTQASMRSPIHKYSPQPAALLKWPPRCSRIQTSRISMCAAFRAAVTCSESSASARFEVYRHRLVLSDCFWSTPVGSRLFSRLNPERLARDQMVEREGYLCLRGHRELEGQRRGGDDGEVNAIGRCEFEADRVRNEYRRKRTARLDRVEFALERLRPIDRAS